MNLCGLNIPSNSHALLTHWMLRSIAVTDSFPRSAVPTLGCRVSVVSFVAFIFFFFMFFAKPALSKLWTAWKRTWSFRLSRQCFLLKCRHNKSHVGIVTNKAIVLFFFADYTISQLRPLQTIANHCNF